MKSEMTQEKGEGQDTFHLKGIKEGYRMTALYADGDVVTVGKATCGALGIQENCFQLNLLKKLHHLVVFAVQRGDSLFVHEFKRL